MQTGLFTFFQSTSAIEIKASEFLGVIGVNLLAIVNQTRQRALRSCRAYASHSFWMLGLRQWARYAPYFRLRQELMHWNRQRNHGSPLPVALQAGDITAIRHILEAARQRSQAELPPALLDQWFFLAIGAIQVESQTGSTEAWHLFDQSVHSQLGERSFYQTLSFGLVASLCAVWMALTPMTHTTVRQDLSPLETAAAEHARGTADPVTLSLLNLAYQKMQSGSCQLPQAAMLPEAQRQAFIVFVTEGTVDVDQVEHLRQALGYVSCLYPQELMRPQGRERLGRE